MSMPAIDIDSMSPEERVRLIAELWDSLPTDAPELSDAERAELDRRLEDLDADIAVGKSLGSSWTEVRARIEARRDRK
jgi:putative addiction module component (TIGR02574 family)